MGGSRSTSAHGVQLLMTDGEVSTLLLCLSLSHLLAASPLFSVVTAIKRTFTWYALHHTRATGCPQKTPCSISCFSWVTDRAGHSYLCLLGYWLQCLSLSAGCGCPSAASSHQQMLESTCYFPHTADKQTDADERGQGCCQVSAALGQLGCLLPGAHQPLVGSQGG